MTIRVEVLQIPGCARADAARRLLLDCLDDLGIPRTAVVERVGPFPSPSIVVNGTDVMGTPEVTSWSCRLDVPTRDRILTALRLAEDGHASQRTGAQGED